MSDVFLKDSGKHVLSLYDKLANMEQEKKEALAKFLDRLREALHRFTEIDPESEEGKVILKDRFLTQSAPDIHRKLLKRASLVAQRLKHLPGMRETRVQSLGWEDPLEKEMATHSSTLAWRIPWREESGRLQSMGSQRVGHD